MSVTKDVIASLVVLVALVVAGCSPNVPTVGPPGATATDAPGVTDGPRGPAATFHAAPDLEASLPGDGAGVALTSESVLGSGFESSRPHRAGLRCRWYETRGLRCRDQAALAMLLGLVGRAPGDVSIAVAYDPSRSKLIEVQALRIAGVTGLQLLDAQLTVESERSATDGRFLETAALELAGRQLTVIRSVRAYPLGAARYLLAADDILYEFRKVDEQTLEVVLDQLG